MHQHISNLSKQVGKILSNYSDNRNAEAIMSYLVERFIYNTCFGLTLIALSVVFDILWPTIAFTGTFILLRRCFGGLHLKSNMLCLLVSITVPLVFSYLATTLELSYIFLVVINGIALGTGVCVGVVDSPKKRLDYTKKKSFRFQGLILSGLTFLIQTLVYFGGAIVISNSIMLGVIITFVGVILGKIFNEKI